MITLKLNGGSRTVLLIGPWAIKFPTLRYGWVIFLKALLANIQEATIWDNCWYDDRLCPVFWLSPGGFCLIQQRVDRVCTYEDPTPDYSRFQGLPKDHKPDNFGWLKGRLVMLDYGCDRWSTGPVEKIINQ